MSFVLPIGLRDFFGFGEGNRPFARSSEATPRENAAARFFMFDAYYCCLLLGLDRSRPGKKDDLENKTFLEGYPDNQKSQAEVIAGLLVDAELKRQDIGPEDRESIEGEMVRLLDLKSPTRLSPHGDELLNLYAVAGFETLKDGMVPPDNLEDFLVAYHGLWQR